MKKFFFIFLFFLFFYGLVSAQYYNIGQDPASVKWLKIKSENFTIIYPDDFTTHAEYLANALQYVRDYGTLTLGHKPKHLTVILHNSTIVPNAFSLWAPKRNEFFTCPPQNNYAQDWIEQLAVHEYRHITQMDMLNKGVTKVLTFLLGQQVTVAVLGLFVPMWFMEGDAVCTETLLSHSGRGRIPSFEMKVRAQVLEKKMFTYDKAVLGSYKDFVPEQYNFGYEMVAYSRKVFGHFLWQNAMEMTGKYPFLITPYNKGLKKVCGMGKNKLYQFVFTKLDSAWTAQKTSTILTSFKPVTADENKIYTNYKFAHYITDSIILAEKSGMDDIARFVIIDKQGNETKIHTPGFYSYESLSITKTLDPGNSGSKEKNSPNSFTTDNLSLSNNLMVWAERKFDKRWGLRDFSVIVTYDFNSGKAKEITKKSRYFAPYLFPDGKKIVAVEVDETSKSSLVIIDAVTGDVIKKIFAGDSENLLTPSVSSDGKTIIVVLFNGNGKSIIAINIESGGRKVLLQPSFKEVTNPMLYKNYLFYNGIYSGLDNIFALDTLSKKIFQVTSALYGANDIDISSDGKKIIYSNYTSDGYQIVQAAFDTSQWIPLEQVKDNALNLYKDLLIQEAGVVDSANIPASHYEPKKYNKLLHLFNPHSWAPLAIDAGNMTVHPGFSLMSQNYLGTMVSTLGYNYSINNKAGKYFADVSYYGWYPVLSLKYEYGKDVLFKDSADVSQNYSWNSSDLKFGISLPLRFTKGCNIFGFNPGISTHIVRTDDVPEINGITIFDKFNVMNYSFSAFNQVKSVERDMRPRWGQAVQLVYKHTPFNGADLGAIFSGEFSLFFPGIARHHSFMISGGYQKKDPGTYSFSDLLFYPRGYADQFNDELKSIRFNYKLPLCYPDFKIGSLLYFKRFKANLFYDYAEGNTGIDYKYYSSTGIEVTTDMNVLRFLFPVDLGVRSTYMPDTKKMNYEFLIGMNFTGF
ncbi:MAG: hypothetical protein V1904_02045 [Bacteroidota bacterium]